MMFSMKLIRVKLFLASPNREVSGDAARSSEELREGAPSMPAILHGGLPHSGLPERYNSDTALILAYTASVQTVCGG